jgi:hypothetical protein
MGNKILKLNNSKISMHLTRGLYKVKETRQAYLAMPIEEKRKLYKCKNDYVPLDKIPTWDEYFKKEKLNSNNGSYYLLKIII